MSGRGRGRGRGRTPPSGARLLLQRSAEEAGLDAGNLRGLQDITRPRLFPDFEWHSSGRIGHDQPSTMGAPHGGGLPISTTTTTTTAPPTTIISSTVSSALPTQSSTTLLSSNKRAKDSMVYLINKSREIQQWFQESPFYVRPSQEVDVERYNKRRRPLEADAHIAAFVGSKLADSKYIPTELFLSSSISSSVSKSRHALLMNESLVGGDDGVPTHSRVLTLEELAAEELERKKNPSNHNNKTNTNNAGEEGGEDQEGELSDTQDLEEEDEDEVADYMQDYYASDDESDGSGGDEAVF